MIKFQSLPRQKRQAIRDEVLRLYAETDLSYGEIAEENGVQVRTVEYIVRNFASELPDIPTMRKKKKDASEEDYDNLRAEVTRLRKELRQEKMRAQALETMIDVAEEMFNTPVRQKAGTKHSDACTHSTPTSTRCRSCAGCLAKASRLITSTMQTRICVAWPWRNWLFAI